MFAGDPNGDAAEVINCRCTTDQKGRWLLDVEETKYLGKTEDMTDEQLESLARKLNIDVDELRKYSGHIIPIRAKNYDDFRRQYEKIWNYEPVKRKAVANSFKSSTMSSKKANCFSVDAKKAYEDAKNGTRHAGVYNDAIKKNDNKLKKSIKSHEEQVEIHKQKITDPAKHDEGWNTKTKQQQEGLLNKWNKDAKRNAEQAAIEKEVLKEMVIHNE